MLTSYDTLYTPRILITGETGGTGASTTSRLLSELLEQPNISGGRFFRAMANRFELFQTQNVALTNSEQYNRFLLLYQETFQHIGVEGISILLGDGLDQQADGNQLARFQVAITESQVRTGQLDSVWDYIVDQHTLLDAFQKPGFIWEAKLAILALEIDQLQSVITDRRIFALPLLKVLLQLDPAVAAERVGQREKRQVSVAEIALRKKRDFERFGKLYTVRGTPVVHADLLQAAELAINTEQFSPKEVVSQIIWHYIKKVKLLTEAEPSLSFSFIQNLATALAELQD